MNLIPVYHFHEPRFSTYGHQYQENPVKKKFLH